MGQRLVVIGGDGGAMTAASQARRRRPDLEIVAFERGSWTSYSACGIPFLVGGAIDRPERLVARSPEGFRAMRIDARTGHEVTAIDLAARTVEVDNKARGRSFKIGFDLLHIGTGAVPVRPDVPGVDLPHVHGVQTLDDATALLASARRIAPKHVVVVGSGYVGLELAESFLDRGVAVTVVDRHDSVMGTLDPDLGGLVARAMRVAGVTIRTGEHLVAIEPGAVHTDKGKLDADLVVLGTGVRPETSLAEAAGITLGVEGTIAVDRRQHTSAEGVWAAGDCCQSYHVVSGLPTYEALGTVANKQGRVAGINLAGGYATFAGVAGTAIARVCATEIGRTGLNEAEAAAAGFDAVAATVKATTIAGYMPGATEMTLKLLAERRSGRVLGVQIVGGQGAAKRVDVVATALHARLGVEDLIGLDLAYAPPFASVWEPVQIAARQLSDTV
jgi:NADPH-dependent 2,4-dienoyl-CoA reductase/sulfur reductase-like enzyme